LTNFSDLEVSPEMWLDNLTNWDHRATMAESLAG